MKIDFMNDFIGNSSYTWVPIVAFVVLILIAGGIGFWNGWKTSLYFFGWNLVGVIVGVLVTSPIMNAFDDIGILKVMSSSAEAMWGLLILFVFMLGINLFAFLFYWIFRRYLKKSIKDNQKANKSNFSSRFIGMGIAIVSVSPTAVYLADSAAVMSPENGFTKFLDSLAKTYTGGKFEGTSEDRDQIKVLADNMDAITQLADIFAGNGDKDELQKPETIAKIQKILNTDITKNIHSIYDGLKSSGMAGIDKTKDLGDVEVKDIANNMPDMGIQLLGDKKEELRKSLESLFRDNGNPNKSKALAAELIKHLTD